MKAYKTGIFGGAFDPIHYGHLVNAETVRSDYHLDRIIFIPSKYTKKKGIDALVPAEDRFAMAVLATEAVNEFEVSRIELDRDGPSYTADTVNILKEQYPDEQLYLIIGSDALDTIANWRKSESLLEQVTLIALRRPGNAPLQFADNVNFTVLYPDNPMVDISSTSIRERLYNGKSVRFMLPDSVIDYIRVHDLYIKKRRQISINCK